MESLPKILRYTSFVSALLLSSLASQAQTVTVALTTADQKNQLTPQSNLSFGTSSTGSFTINVNSTQSYQTWDGVGGAMTDSTATVIAGLPSSVQTTLMNSLFTQSSGVGLNFIRVPMGASDFSASGAYTYDDGAADPNLTRFSISHDLTHIIPLIKQAISINPAVKVIATPWSPPAWMKNEGTLYGGTFNTAYAGSLAQYFVKFIAAYKAQGIPIYAVAVQNEPRNSTSAYPSENLAQADEYNFINNNLGPALAAAGYGSVKIFGYDHNWDNTAYPEAVAASSYTTGTAFHCYEGVPSAEATVRNATSKDTWITECTRINSQSFTQNLQQDAEQLIIGGPTNTARGVVMWNFVLNQNNGPTLNSGVCQSCLGVVNANTSTGTLQYNSEYFAMGHIGKYVVPGAVNIYTSSQSNGGILDVGFRNPDGTIAVIAYNDSSSNSTVTVNWNNKYFNYPLAAGSMVTFKWAGN